MPTHDASSSSGTQSNVQNTGDGAAPDYSHTAGTLTNGIAIVRVCSQDSTPGTITGVTYGGNACIQIGSAVGPTASAKASLWYHLNPSAGSSAVVASFTEVMNAHTVSVSTYSDVDQSTPYVSRANNPQSANDFDTVNPSEARVTIDSAVGELVVAVALFVGPTVSGATAQNSRSSQLVSGNHFHGGSDADGAATVAMSWTLAQSQQNAILGVSLQAPVVTTVSPTTSDAVTVAEGTTMHMGINIPLMKLT